MVTNWLESISVILSPPINCPLTIAVSTKMVELLIPVNKFIDDWWIQIM
jgi:hypothetical protein